MEADASEMAGQAISRVLVALTAELEDQLDAVLRDDQDAVHQARIRVRRIRSILAAYRRLFRRDETDALRLELKGFGTALGAARDAEVRTSSIHGLLASGAGSDAAAEAAPEVTAAVGSLTDHSRAQYAAARYDLLALLNGPEIVDLLGRLEDFARVPPFRDRAHKPAKPVVSAALREAAKRLERRAAVPDLDELDALHEVRKSARRLRYAADAVSSEPSPVLGDEARELSDAAKAVQELLGDHRDDVLTARYLRAEAGSHPLDASASAGVGELAARCEETARARLSTLGDALAAIRRQPILHN